MPLISSEPKRDPEPDLQNDLWSSVRDRLCITLGQGIFDSWIAPLSLVSMREGQVHLSAPSRLVRDYVACHYATRIERAFAATTVEFVSLEIGYQPSSATVPVRKSVLPFVSSTSDDNTKTKNVSRNLWDRELDPNLDFRSFITGSCNEFALKAAERIAEKDNPTLSTLFVHGEHGYGKTHLLNATALEARAQGQRVLFLRAEDFMRCFLDASRGGETLVFGEVVRDPDIFLVDDLQSLRGPASTVFCGMMRAMIGTGRKIVIAANKPLALLDGFPDDLRSLLLGALTIELGKPDAATRLAILKARAPALVSKLLYARLPDELLQQLANEVDGSPRQLLGVLLKITTYTDLTRKAPTPELVAQTIETAILVSAEKVSIEKIQARTAEYYKLDLRELHSARRARVVARPRQVAMYLSRELTNRSLPYIGRRFGGRDHTTVLHACRRIEALCKSDSRFCQEVDFLRKTLSRQTASA